MGANTSKPLNEWTSDEVSEELGRVGVRIELSHLAVFAILTVGPKFAEYRASIVDNGVDGTLLASLTEDELEETLEDLEITNRLHKRILQKKLATVPREDEEASETEKDLTETENAENGQHHSVVIKESSELMKEEDLAVFDKIVTEILGKTETSIFYVGIHLIKEEGQIVLSGTVRSADDHVDVLPRWHLSPHSMSICSTLVRKMAPDTYLEKALPSKSMRYRGHVLRDDRGKRIGSVCLMEKMLPDPQEDVNKQEPPTSGNEDYVPIMKEMASHVERQMQERQALLARTASLQAQIKSLEGDDNNSEKVTKLFLNAVKEGPSPAGGGQPLILPPITKNSAEEPCFQQGRAGPGEMIHLPADFFKLHDQFGLPRPPIAKDDMQSIAAAEELNLHAIQPDSATGKRLIQLVTMAAKMAGCPMCTLNFHDHEQEFEIGRPVVDESLIAPMLERAEINLTRRSADGCPFSYGCARAPAMCNYTMFLKKSFVVPDIAEDATFRIVTEMSGARFYAATPLIAPDGCVLATLCVVDSKPHHDFDQSQLTQLEQHAYMVMQEIQNWSMWNKVEMLEKTRTRLLAVTEKSHPPTGEATIVRTDVAGSTALWEKNADAMQSALEIHDCILRECSLKHHGYEIDTAGDAFYLAFHDPVDAVKFALDTQQLLYEADWSEDILALPEAESEGECFRGLRVRMGIVHGAVRCVLEILCRVLNH